VSENPKSVELHAALQQLRLYQELQQNSATAATSEAASITTEAISDAMPAATAAGSDAVPAAEPVAPNVVTVSPGGGIFPTISAAIASITDASLKKQYLLTVSPGTFNERVVMKPWVFVQGSGQENTIITAPPTSDVFSRGTVVGASNSGISNLTISCIGGTWGDWSSALVCAGAVAFYAEALVLTVTDSGNAGINLETVGIDINLPNSGGSQVYFAYCYIQSVGENGESTSANLSANGNAYVEVTNSKLIAQGGGQSFGALSDSGASLNIFDSYIQGGTYALYIPSNGAITATNCQIDGQVSNGVQIINDPPPSE
jgi:hypothetical protein